MTWRHFKQDYHKLILLAFVCILPLTATGNDNEVIYEKRVAVAMRMIGHEVLMSLGDCESRIMPIEKIDGRYQIPFELEFGFDPGAIVSIVDSVMTKTGIASEYLVEVEQCETKAVVHSFEIGRTTDPDQTACVQRTLPEDCYSLFITLLKSEEILAGSSSLMPSEANESSFFSSALLIIPFLFLIGFMGYFMKKDSGPEDPNLIRIGASQFDKRNMALSFNNQKVELSNKEAELLSLLSSSANVPIEREVILHKVWGDEGDYIGRTLDVFISKLRKKLEADVSVKILNIRGVGYKLVMDVSK